MYAYLELTASNQLANSFWFTYVSTESIIEQFVIRLTNELNKNTRADCHVNE